LSEKSPFFGNYVIIFSSKKSSKKKKRAFFRSISNDLWYKIEKLLSKNKNRVGRPEFDNKKAFNGIIFVLKTGIQWHNLPEKYDCSSTAHGKFMRWCRLGIFQKMIVKAREYYRRRNSKNIWYAFDTLVKKGSFAKYGGKNPTDHAKRGVKQTLLVDRKGAPLFVGIAPANQHDSHSTTLIIPLPYTY